MGVVGCGYWGRNHVRVLAELDALSAVTDVDPAVATEMETRFGAPACHFNDLLSSPEIDAVVIATPAVTHYSLALAALRAGKDVFVEKPLALEVGQASELCAEAETRGLILMVGHLLRYHPAFEALAELVRSGRLGRPRYVYSTRLNLGKFRTEENILWSFAPHDISMILALMVEQPLRVSATGGFYLSRDVADITTTHLLFSGGARAHIFVSWLHPYKEQKLVVVGDEAMATFDDSQGWDNKVSLFEHDIDLSSEIPRSAKRPGAAVAVEPEEPLLAQSKHFLKSVSSRTSPLTDGREGLRVLEVLTLAEKSMKNEATLQQLDSDGVTVHPTAIIDQPSWIGTGTKIWHYSHVLSGSRIGRECTIGQNVMIGPDVAVGDGCKIQNNVSVYKGVTLEDCVFCGPSVVFTNVINPRADVDRRDQFVDTLVEEGATLGANCTIVCGVTIGRRSFVAAGAVVTKDVIPHALVAGVPARRVGWVGHAGDRLGPDLVCQSTGRRYREKDGLLEEIRE